MKQRRCTLGGIIQCNVTRMVTGLWEVYGTWERLVISELERVLTWSDSPLCVSVGVGRGRRRDLRGNSWCCRRSPGTVGHLPPLTPPVS